MKGKDGFPCGLARNEKIMSTTVLAYSRYLHLLKSTAYQKAQRDKDPEGYKRMVADRKREERRRKKIAVMEQYGYTVRKDAL